MHRSPASDRTTTNEAATSAGSSADPAVAAQLLRFFPDVLRLLSGVARDPRVPRRAKTIAASFVALGLSPVDAVPVLGAVGLVVTVSLAVRALLEHAGEEVLEEHWHGSDEGLRLVRALAAAGPRPRRVAWHLIRRRHG